MAATVYASLVSLLNTLDLIHIHPLVSTFFNLHQNKSLSKKVNFLVDFVEEYSDADSREVEDLVRRIADAAQEAENMVEVYVADRVRGRGENMSILPDLQKIMEEMESIKEEVIKVKEEIIKVKEEIRKSCSFLPDRPPSSSSAAAAAPPREAGEATAMMGFDDYKRKLLDDILGYDADRQIISITGMGGIGKTTLARNLYENYVVVRHFNVRVWVTVSQDASARRVFCQALSCLEGGSVDWDRVNDQQLSEELYKALYNRRYLIILDDVWSVEIWDKIKFFFPQNNNRSRIVVTTRESKLVDFIGSSTVSIGFLDMECSWKLFCEKTFPQEDFPPELEAVGKKIVKKCGGLPLAISVIGGLLKKSPRTQQYWEQVEENRSLILNSEENKPSSILYLSYKYLPVCLKPCFLFFGLYPEDYKMHESNLISHWIAEGFIKANKSQSLEEVAISYINQLVGRNLLLLVPSRQRLKEYSTHDIVRDLCLEIGEKENFYRIQRSLDEIHHFITDQTTAARFYHDQEFHVSKTPSIYHPLIVHQESRVAPIKTRLLKVFISFEETSCFDALQEVNLRYLRNDEDDDDEDDVSFPLLSQFWSLQTLDLGMVFEAPIEIWKMPQLRHIQIWCLCLPNPPPSDEDFCVLENLQTLDTVQNLIFTEEVCKRIPNIKQLAIEYDLSPAAREASPCYHLENLVSFNKLEFLYYRVLVVECHAGDSLRSIKFPSSLKELILDGCKLEWSYMAVVASLPHLEYLSTQYDAFVATKWVFADERFVSLKVLHISDNSHVTKWIADSSNFPVLEYLFIESMEKLRKIPSSTGEIPTLRSINMSLCMESANMSAVKMLHEQEMFGNLDLQVKIWTEKPELLREKVQDLGFTCQNLVIECECYHLISPS